jgi:toxin ParE1/3/4
LAHFPERGSYPKELLALGIKEYRQTSFKPYRVIYRVLDRQVLIYLIVDGRRDMQSLLSRRLLAG